MREGRIAGYNSFCQDCLRNSGVQETKFDNKNYFLLSCMLFSCYLKNIEYKAYWFNRRKKNHLHLRCNLKAIRHQHRYFVVFFVILLFPGCVVGLNVGKEHIQKNIRKVKKFSDCFSALYITALKEYSFIFSLISALQTS